MAVCYSCHPGGGPAEGIVQGNGTVIPYDDPSLSPVHSYDRDFYTYGPNATTLGLYGGDTIAETVNNNGSPYRHDWEKTGVMEADCLLCHIDPEAGQSWRATDGLLVKTFRPRLMIFAERQNGKVTKISLGMPLKIGLQNESVLNYTDPVQRFSRPTALFTMAQMPAELTGQMMKMWTDGLKQIEQSGKSLPYGLYAPPQVVSKIWGAEGLRPEYCANPNGPADEMQRLMATQNDINQLFAGFLGFLKENGVLPPEATMDQMMSMFFNDFIYGYRIKSQMGTFMPIPVPLRAYEPGKFYSNWDSPDASVRDYVRAPLVEGEGIPYSGRVGSGWQATMFAIGRAMQGDFTYMKADGSPDVSKVFEDIMAGKLPADIAEGIKHDYLPSFFSMMPTAVLMGIDLNGDNMPLSYIQLVNNGSDWEAKAYYNEADLGNGVVKLDIFGGREEANSYKWVKVCGQCHVMTKDHGNSEWSRARLYNLGMPADWVKNGQFVNWTDDPEAPGYDVHMSSKKMGCGSCHLREKGNIETLHNFLKGTDTAHMVRNDLDNNPRPKTCEYCHLNGGDPAAPNPSQAHEEKFGENTGRHMALMECEVCHQPYKRSWRFRAFDDTLGYYGNFDNRFGLNVLPGGDGSMMAFPPEYALSPVYGTSPGYGIPHFHMLSQHIDADGSGKIVPMDFVAQMVNYFWMDGSADPGLIVNGFPTNMRFDFWRYFYDLTLNNYQAMGVPLNYDPNHDNEVYPPLYYANIRNGYPQITIGNPITILTWVDVNPQPDHDMKDIAYGGAKVLYLREINSAIKAYMMPTKVGMVDPMAMAMIPPNDPTYAANPYVGKIILKDSGYVIFDHTGDMYPDLWWPEDVRAMQQALIKVLKAEGEPDPKPVIFMAAHYFSDSHGIQPAEKALGASSCYDCHGDYTKDPGAHRITDRVITYLPWAPPWFSEDGRFLRYEPENVPEDAPIWMKRAGMVLNNPEGYFVVDGEVAYIKPIKANNLSILGAKAEDVLKLSKHHAEELFYMVAEGHVRGDEIEEIEPALLTPEERETDFVRQVVASPWNQKLYFYIPAEIKPHLAECGFQPTAEEIYIHNKGLAEAYVAKIGFAEHEGGEESMIIKLPYSGVEPVIVTMKPGQTSFRKDKSAVILSQTSGYVTVKVNHPGEFAAVNGNMFKGVNVDLWKAFIKD